MTKGGDVQNAAGALFVEGLQIRVAYVDGGKAVAAIVAVDGPLAQVGGGACYDVQFLPVALGQQFWVGRVGLKYNNAGRVNYVVVVERISVAAVRLVKLFPVGLLVQVKVKG